MINTLVTGTGGGVGQSIIKSLKLSNLKTRIVTADMHPLATGLFRGNRGYVVPPARSLDYIDRILDICKRESTQILFVGSDPELPVFAENRDRIERETGAKVVISSPEQIKIGNDKWETYLFFKKHRLPYPESALPDTMQNLVTSKGFPLLIKPRSGSASQDVFIVHNQKELDVFVKRIKDPVLQEYLEPADEEYTSGTIMFGGELFGAITMKRDIKGGNTYRAIVDDYDIVRKEVMRLARVFNAFGPANFQMRLTDEGPVTFEINPRFSGTTGIRAFFGFNEPEAAINYLLFQKKTKMTYKKGIALRYMNEVYITHDDWGKINSMGQIDPASTCAPDYF